MALRFDAFTIDKFERTPAGALRITGTLSRAGVFTYHGPAGAVREYRPANVVTRQDTIASFRDLPLTVGHPTRMVNADDWSSVAVGHISSPRAEGDKVIGDVIVSRKDVIDAVERRELKELSPGYAVALEDKPGRTDAGEDYDRITTRMVVNHVAILPPGKSRQGIGLRLDAADDQVLDENCTRSISAHITEATMKIKIRLDGKTHEVDMGSDEYVELVKKCDARDAENVKLRKDLETANAKNEVLTKQVEQVKTDAAQAVAKAGQAAAKRAASETAARKILGPEFKFDAVDAAGKSVPMTDRQIHEAVCKAKDPSFVGEGRSDEAVAAMCEVWTSNVDTSRQDSIAALASAAPVNGARKDADKDEDEDPVKKSTSEQYKKPMAYSRA